MNKNGWRITYGCPNKQKLKCTCKVVNFIPFIISAKEILQKINEHLPSCNSGIKEETKKNINDGIIDITEEMKTIIEVSN